MEFWRVFRLVYARRWLIAAMMAVAAAVILIGASLKAQITHYEAEALIQPQDVLLPQVMGQSSAGGDLTGVGSAADRMTRVSDLIMLLRSSNDLYLKTASLLRLNEADRAAAVDRILDRNGYFAPVYSDIETQATQLVTRGELTASKAEGWIRENRAVARKRIVGGLTEARDDLGAFAPAGIDLTENQIAERIRKNLQFETVNGPLNSENNPQIVNQIRVSGQFDREAEADLYVNVLCVAFIDFYTSKSAGAAVTRIALLQQKRNQASQRLQKARDAEVTFRRSQGTALSAAQDAAVTQLIAFQNRLAEAQQDREAATAAVRALQQLVATGKGSVTTPLPADENPLVRELQRRVAEAQISFDKVNASNAGEKSDIYEIAKAELDTAKRELNQALSRPFRTTTVNTNQGTMEAQLAAATVRRDESTRRVTELERQVAAQSAIVSSLPAAQAKLADLRREIVIAEKNASEIETQLSRNQLLAIENGRAGTVTIVSQAHASRVGGDIGSQRGRLMVYGAILAFLFGAGMVVGVDALDNSMRSASDVEKMLGLPVAGIIPTQLPEPFRAPRIAFLEPLSPEAEAYRLLRADLLFTAAERPYQSLMTVTGKPGQGATTTISNLAITLAQAGHRVILIDADLRYPKLHNIYRLANTVGLTTLLTEGVALSDVLQPTDVENLSLLSAGPIVLNPSELLGSKKMRTLHDELKQQADYVLFDSPSAIAFSDASLLSSLVDRVLMVVRASNVPRGSEERVLSMLNKAHANILGVVLNDVPASRVDSVYYHYNYYPALPPGSTNTVSGMPGGASPLALPAGTNRGKPDPASISNTSHATLVDQAYPRRAGRLTIPWRLLLVAGILALIVGALVLTLAGGVNVR